MNVLFFIGFFVGVCIAAAIIYFFFRTKPCAVTAPNPANSFLKGKQYSATQGTDKALTNGDLFAQVYINNNGAVFGVAFNVFATGFFQKGMWSGAQYDSSLLSTSDSVDTGYITIAQGINLVSKLGKSFKVYDTALQNQINTFFSNNIVQDEYLTLEASGEFTHYVVVDCKVLPLVTWALPTGQLELSPSFSQ